MGALVVHEAVFSGGGVVVGKVVVGEGCGSW